MSFVQVTIVVPPSDTRDIIIAQLSELGFDGFEEKDNELLCSVAEINFDETGTSKLLKTYQLEFSRQIIKEQNWNAVWESNFEPVVIDDFCAVRALFHAPAANVKHEIIITPKMSFGTGHHATTYLMIEQMRTIDFKNKLVADFGTGTGILAILAEKLGAKSVLAIDEDDWSIENAGENIAENKCRLIHLEKQNSFLPNRKFEVILANINKNIILLNLQNLVEGLQADGYLLLSGLLNDDEKEVADACNMYSLFHVNTLEKNKWISILYRKNVSP